MLEYNKFTRSFNSEIKAYLDTTNIPLIKKNMIIILISMMMMMTIIRIRIRRIGIMILRINI